MSYFASEINNKIVELLTSGAVGLLPTDTIYGLSAIALNERAVEKVHKLKGRDDSKPLIVLIAEIDQLSELGLKKENATPIKEHWPGPLSVEFDATNAPTWLHRGGYFFAVRMPKNEDLLALIKETGPLVSTSANLQGQEPAKSVEKAKKYFGGELDFYVDVGEIIGESSTLVKLVNNKVEIIRQGAYKLPL